MSALALNPFALVPPPPPPLVAVPVFFPPPPPPLLVFLPTQAVQPPAAKKARILPPPLDHSSSMTPVYLWSKDKQQFGGILYRQAKPEPAAAAAKANETKKKKQTPKPKRKPARTRDSRAAGQRTVSPCEDLSHLVSAQPIKEFEFNGFRIAVHGSKKNKLGPFFVATDVMKALSGTVTSRKNVSNTIAKLSSPMHKVQLTIERPVKTLAEPRFQHGANCLTMAGLEDVCARRMSDVDEDEHPLIVLAKQQTT